MNASHLPLLSSVLALALLAAPGAAQSAPAPLIYGLNETGKTTINGTVLDSLPTSFDPDTPNQNGFQRWESLQVVGADRYALRLDGTLYKNGKSLYKLPFVAVNGLIFTWDALTVSGSSVYALREDGLLTANGTAVVTLPRLGFGFLTALAVGTDVFSLRTDGAVFLNSGSAPAFTFVGGPGIDIDADGAGPDTSSTTALDGVGSETWWLDLAINPATGDLYALRRDGKVAFANLLTNTVSADVADLPFPTDPAVLTSDEALNNNRYRKLAFTADGVWHAVRGNGQIYTPASLLVPLVDLPTGDGNTAIDDTYLDMATDGNNFWTIRWDGRLYQGTDTTAALNLLDGNYRNIEASEVAPDLSNVKNPKPLAETYKVTTVEGQAVGVPVYATDIETPPSQLSVTLQDPLKKPLPPGLTFNADPDNDPLTPPTITWDNPTPKGSYTVPVVVNDGVNKPKTFNYVIKVILPDANPLKNKKPIFAKLKNLQALVGFDYALQMFAVDPDPGDTVSLTVDTSKEPFLSQGATFDATAGTGTGTFHWTPTFDNIGKTKVKFFATDQLGGTTSYTITIKVVNSLIFATPF